LQRNQRADSRCIDGINPGQIEGDIPPMLSDSRTQNGSLIASYNSALTL
jgi:hypothetical protein